MIVILCSKNVLLRTEPSVFHPLSLKVALVDLTPVKRILIKRILGYVEVRSML